MILQMEKIRTKNALTQLESSLSLTLKFNYWVMPSEDSPVLRMCSLSVISKCFKQMNSWSIPALTGAGIHFRLKPMPYIGTHTYTHVSK